MHKTIASFRIHPFCSNVILYSSALTTHAYFVLRFPILWWVSPTALYRYCARHCCWHRNFQLSTSGFHSEFEFFVVWLNEEYSSQVSSVFELWFLDSPSLFCFLFRCIGHKFPHIWPYIIRTRGCLFPRKSPPGQGVGLSFSRKNLVNPVHASDNSLSPPTFQQSSIFFSNNTSSDVCVVLVMLMYVIGIGNESSFGTCSLTLGTT